MSYKIGDRAGDYEIEMQVDVSTNATGTFRVKLVR